LAKLKRPTYRDLMDVVSTQVSAAYPNQNPQLEGADIDQFVFGDASSLPQPYFLITTGGSARVILGAGQLHGITAGSVFRVYAPGSKRFSPPERPIANVRVSAVTPYTSEANVLGKGSVPDSSRAVEQEHRYENLRLRVYLDGPPDSAELEAVRRELADDKHIEFVSAAARCHVQVRQRGSRFLTLSADGYTLSTPIEVSRADAGARIGGQLAQWAKWFNVFHIQNSQGPDIQFNVSAVRSGLLSGRLDASLKDRGKVDLTIQNKSGKDLYVAVLDLSSDGSIEMSYPVEQGAAELLKAGGTVSHRMEMFVPKGRSVVKDTFKLFVSTKAIDLRPITQGRIKGAPDIAPGDDPLNDLIAEAAGRMRGSRPVDTGQWTTAQRTIIVRR
jgi:hypothetical protein